MKNKKPDKKIIVASTTAGATGSIVSAHNVCHMLCIGAVALLSVFGIAVASDALMWLEAFAWPFWIMGIAFLGLSLLLYWKFGNCISWNMIIINAGLLLIGTPFAQDLQWLIWAPGTAIAAFGMIMIVKQRIDTVNDKKVDKYRQ